MSRKSDFIGLYTITRKEITRILRIWTQTILPSGITMTLYFLVFGSLIGSRIGEMGGYSYIDFIVPGLIMMAVITNSYSNVSSSFFGTKFQKNLEELLVSPLPNSFIIFGYVLGGIFRAILVGILVTIISLFFTDLKIYNIYIIISTILLTSLVFSLAGFLNALYARKFDDVAIVPTFVLTPLTYLGGVFFSVSLLSGVWYFLSKLNPILYMVDTFRYGFLGISDVNIYLAFTILIALSIALFSLNLYLLKKGKGVRN